MSEGMKYKIVVKGSDAQRGITKENICVGDLKAAGSENVKYTSGFTSGEEYSYVLFDTWRDVVAAVGGVSEPIIAMEANEYIMPDTGGTSLVTITVEDGYYVDYEISPSLGNVGEERTGDGAILTLPFLQNTSGEDIIYTVTAKARSNNPADQTIYGKSIEITHSFRKWALSNMDYILFTYDWTSGSTGGSDLDSFTFIDGLATSSTDTYGYTFEKGVGFGNGKTDGAAEGERYVGDENLVVTSGITKSLLRFGGDNTAPAGEYTLINLNNLNTVIKNAVEGGIIQPNERIIIYLMGTWYSKRNDGYMSIKFEAYRGGNVTLDNKKYKINNYIEKSDYDAEQINVFSAYDNGILSSKGANVTDYAITRYTTIAAFVYNYANASFFLVTDRNELMNIENGKRFSYGFNSYTYGSIYVDGSGWATSLNIAIPGKYVYFTATATTSQTRVYNFNYYYQNQECGFRCCSGNTPENVEYYRFVLTSARAAQEGEEGFVSGAVVTLNQQTVSISVPPSDSPHAKIRIYIKYQNYNSEHWNWYYPTYGSSYIEIGEKIS